ncbi:Laminin subunit beta-1 [Trichinella pseudospiralis]|uniref:Laminin subunit beta-1 n=1 Tax=Trichinella pseudospiralis TaxID=6337 RepID=A0A0V0XQT1_TRIPS|nr:Laminin subunit beta-1 [Trichinella pseudospiralis]
MKEKRLHAGQHRLRGSTIVTVFIGSLFLLVDDALALVDSSSSSSSSLVDICNDRSCYPATGNLLIGRENRLTASSTCGLVHPDRYCIVSHLEDRKKCFTCNSRQPWARYVNERSHRIENVVSDRFEMRAKKWWQSENGLQNVTVRLDLEAEFHFTHLIMTFKSFRPAAMIIERSSDFGKTWKIYRYFAYDCAESFPGVPEGMPRRHTDVICDSRYSFVAPSTGGEVVFKVLSPHIALEDPYSEEIQDLLRVTNLRINFTKLHTLGDNLLDNRPEITEKYYYAVYEMVVRGSCSCYGHASRCKPIDDDGVVLLGTTRPDMVHGRCECTHHTKGLNCEECEDFYNDLPWKPAIDRETNACKKCNCNEHANRCHFDHAVYEASGFVSGGVCDDCQHNTMGKNCEMCKPYFYRDPDRALTDPYVCRACECDLRGSLNQGICESETDPERNLISGRCHCKVHVVGDHCDACKNGYWNLDQDNPDGCTACTCNLLGTVNNEGCDKRTGECTCKRLVTGDNCDRCLLEHYGLSEQLDGCKPCDCDIGGAYDNSCDVMNGQCRCRAHFSGRRCDIPESGYYCASLDFYTYEAEEALLEGPAEVELREPYWDASQPKQWTGSGFVRVRESSVLNFAVHNIHVAMDYNVILRYESPMPSTWQNVRVDVIRPSPPDPTGPCANSLPKDDFMQQVSLKAGERVYDSVQTVCLEPNVQYHIRVTFGEYQQTGYPDRTAALLIDSLVLMPSSSAIAMFFNGCLLYTSRCPGYWGFPDCRPCQCNGHANVCDQRTGACVDCRDLTAGHHCEQCQLGYYGDPRLGVGIPCRPCPCPGGPGSGFQHADSCYLDVIGDNLKKLTNIQAILQETRQHSTEAQLLKNRADQSKVRIETVEKTAQEVIKALNDSKHFQTIAKQAILSANENFDQTNQDLKAIAETTKTAEQIVNASVELLASLREDLKKVEVEYLQIGKDVERALLVSESARQKTQDVEVKRKTLEEQYKEAEILLNEKIGDNEAARQRAEQLRQTATKLLEKTEKHLSDIEELRKIVSVNEVTMSDVENRLAGLLSTVDAATDSIQYYLKAYDHCSCPSSEDVVDLERPSCSLKIPNTGTL